MTVLKKRKASDIKKGKIRKVYKSHETIPLGRRFNKGTKLEDATNSDAYAVHKLLGLPEHIESIEIPREDQ